MTTPSTLRDYLKKAGVAVQEPSAPDAEAAKIAAAKAAAEKVAAEKAAAEKAAADKAAAEKAAAAKTASAAVALTEAQQKLAAAGITVADPAVAQALFDQQIKAAQAQKIAELRAVNAEYEARGALMLHGYLKEAMAIALAQGAPVEGSEVVKTAAFTGSAPEEIVARAAELRKVAELAAASPHSAFFGNAWASGAREGDVLARAEQNGATTVYPAGDGPRAPVSGAQTQDLRFQQPVTLPGNAGLNHGQQVDGGKA